MSKRMRAPLTTLRRETTATSAPGRDGTLARDGEVLTEQVCCRLCRDQAQVPVRRQLRRPLPLRPPSTNTSTSQSRRQAIALEDEAASFFSGLLSCRLRGGRLYKLSRFPPRTTFRITERSSLMLGCWILCCKHGVTLTTPIWREQEPMSSEVVR